MASAADLFPPVKQAHNSKLTILTKRVDPESSNAAAWDRSASSPRACPPPPRRLPTTSLILPPAKSLLIAAFMLCFYMMWSIGTPGELTGLADLLPHGLTPPGLSLDALRLETGALPALVIYDYQGRDEEDADNLRFFLAAGVGASDGNEYLIIAADPTAPLPKKGMAAEPPPYPLPPLYDLPPNVRVVLRPPQACASKWGVLGWALSTKTIRSSAHDAFILLDSSMRGPFLPPYWPSLVPWTAALMSRLRGATHMAGATIVTDPTPPGPGAPPGAVARPSPRVAGAVAFDRLALRLLRADPEVLACHGDVQDALWFSEAGASAAQLKGGRNLDCLQVRYQNRDWRDRSLWGWREAAAEVDGGPYQVMFVPLRSELLGTSGPAVAAHQLSVWAMQSAARRRDATTADNEGGGEGGAKQPVAKKIQTSATDKAVAALHKDVLAMQAASKVYQTQRKAEKKEAAVVGERASRLALLQAGQGHSDELPRQQGGRELNDDGDDDDEGPGEVSAGGGKGALPHSRRRQLGRAMLRPLPEEGIVQ